MTFHYIPLVSEQTKRDYMTSFKVSDLSNLQSLGYDQEQINKDYDILEDLFRTQEV